MFDIIDTLKKVFSKRYFVIFFDKENMPEEGTQITVGDLTAEFKKSAYDKVAEQMDKIGQVVQDKMYAPPQDNVWECRKCHYREVKK
jgi:hypothetical protein